MCVIRFFIHAHSTRFSLLFTDFSGNVAPSAPCGYAEIFRSVPASFSLPFSPCSFHSRRCGRLRFSAEKCLFLSAATRLSHLLLPKFRFFPGLPRAFPVFPIFSVPNPCFPNTQNENSRKILPCRTCLFRYSTFSAPLRLLLLDRRIERETGRLTAREPRPIPIKNGRTFRPFPPIRSRKETQTYENRFFKIRYVHRRRSPDERRVR